MCGNALESPRAAEPEKVVEKEPPPVEPPAREETRPAEREAEPVSTARAEVPREIRFVQPRALETKARSDKWWVDEGESATGGGMSVLGLSSAPPPPAEAPQPREEEVEREQARKPVAAPIEKEPKPRSDKWWVDERENTTVGGMSVLGLSSAPPPPAKVPQPREEVEREQAREPIAAPVENEPKPRSDKWWVDERENTTVGGPSFLGLSGDETSDGGYSYLLDEEAPRSHKGVWVLLVVLAILGGVVYAKWQPIRDYVLTTAISHSKPPQPAAQPPANDNPANAAPSSPTAPNSEPSTTLATSDNSSQPTITTEPPNSTAAKPASNATDQPKTAADNKPPEENKPAQDNASAKTAGSSNADQQAQGAAAAPAKADKQASSSAALQPGPAADSKAAAPASKEPAKRAQAANPKAEPASDDASADTDEDTNAVEEQPQPAARKPRTARANPGTELVNNGERYLYGRGVARNCNQAISYFNAAASQQNPQALSHLGALYATGECVPMDRVTAYAYFRRAYAKEPSNHYFEQNLTMLWREMTPDERQRATGSKMSSF